MSAHLSCGMPAAAAQGVAVPLLQVRGLTVSYHGKAALRGLNLDLAAGKITALIGPSGCGKTSFLNSLNRLTDLVPGARCEGRVLFKGADVLQPGVDLVALRRAVGMIFQKPNPFPLSIRRNLELPLREHGMRGRAGLDESIERGLRDVGLWDEVKDRLHAPALALSGGQQQRLCLARALVLKPEVLLMDEPCSALDPLSSGVVEDLIARMRGSYTIAIVTHNLAQARRLADFAALFWVQDGCGCLIEHGPKVQLFEQPRHELTASYIQGRRG